MAEPERRACPVCGEMIPVGARLCRFCRAQFDEQGRVLPGAAAPPSAPAVEGDATGGLIPYKNGPALAAYYCGVFSIIPCFVIGLLGLFLGLRGLKVAKANPAVRGKVHAWIGIIVGGFFGVIYALLTVLAIVGPLLSR
jgi:hypothetical protein